MHQSFGNVLPSEFPEPAKRIRHLRTRSNLGLHLQGTANGQPFGGARGRCKLEEFEGQLGRTAVGLIERRGLGSGDWGFCRGGHILCLVGEKERVYRWRTGLCSILYFCCLCQNICCRLCWIFFHLIL